MRLDKSLHQMPILVLALLIGFTVSVCAAAQQDYDDCSQTVDVSRSIAACTRVIDDQTQSAADRANAYVQRANDYVGSDKLDEAIADYGAALSLIQGISSPMRPEPLRICTKMIVNMLSRIITRLTPSMALSSNVDIR